MVGVVIFACLVFIFGVWVIVVCLYGCGVCYRI